MATLIGYGCERDQPVPAVRHRRRARRRRAASPASTTSTSAERNIVKAIGKGLLKTISKMGISTIQSYCGAQIFEAVGLEKALIDRHFTGTASRIGGIGIDVLARETLDRHAAAYPADHDDAAARRRRLRLAPRRRAPQWNPETIALLQHSVRDVERRRAGEVRRVRRAGQRRRVAPRDAARAHEVHDRRRRARSTIDEVEPAQGDRQALRHRRDVARLDLARVARDARDRDEPPRRQVEHRRGRGGPASASRPTPTATRAARRSSRSRRAASA